MILSPKKKPAPTWLAYLVTFTYIIIGVLFFILGKSIFESNTIKMLVCSLAIVILVLIDFAISQLFAWYVNAELKATNKFLAYNYKNVVNVLGHDTTKNFIRGIDKLSKRGSKLVIYGDIETAEPLSKPKKS